MGKGTEFMKNDKTEDVSIGKGKIWESCYSCFQHFAGQACKNVVYVFIVSYVIYLTAK